MDTIKKSLFCVGNLLLIIFLSIFLSGCEDKEDILDQYAGKRLGVIVETNNSEYESVLSSKLIDYISRRADLEVVDPELLLSADLQVPSSPKASRQFYREELELDLLLTVKITDILFKKSFPSFNFGSEYMEVKITHSCSLTLAYTLRDLESDKRLNIGQKRGEAKKSIKIGAGKGKVKIDPSINSNLTEDEEYELLEKAMLDAMRDSDLI